MGVHDPREADWAALPKESRDAVYEHYWKDSTASESQHRLGRLHVQAMLTVASSACCRATADRVNADSNKELTSTQVVLMAALGLPSSLQGLCSRSGSNSNVNGAF
eukprot:2446590-Amphidinium_carterae.2